ncbi:MAG: integrase [Gammaproteobacteria bacterium]|jgi:integrase
MPLAGDAVRIASHTGLTCKEVLQHSPEHVKDGSIRFTRTKTSTSGVIPVASPIKDIVRDKLPLKITEYVLRKEFEAARKKIGMPDLHCHDLRHTFGGFLAGKAKASDREIQELMRLKSFQMVTRYAKLRDESLKQTMNKL